MNLVHIHAEIRLRANSSHHTTFRDSFGMYRWFRQTKFTSFQRQLNIYGFKRITQGKCLNKRLIRSLSDIASHTHTHNFVRALFYIYPCPGPDKGTYYHEFFLRGKRALAHRIARTKIKGQGHRSSADPEEEPDFYRMPFLPDNKKTAAGAGGGGEDRKPAGQSMSQAAVAAAFLAPPAAAFPGLARSQQVVGLSQALMHQAYQAVPAPSTGTLMVPPAPTSSTYSPSTTVTAAATLAPIPAQTTTASAAIMPQGANANAFATLALLQYLQFRQQEH